MCKKVTVSPLVDWDELASATEGYSGADLQAIIYNAHLEVIHQTLAEKQHSSTKGKGKGKATETSDDDTEERIEYVALGGDKESVNRTRAEEEALQKRVSANDWEMVDTDTLLRYSCDVYLRIMLLEHLDHRRRRRRVLLRSRKS